MREIEDLNYTDIISKAVESYLVFFEAMTSAGVALFLSCAVIILRESGIRKNNDIADTDWTLLIIAASAFSGLSLLFSKILGPNSILSFHREALKAQAYSGCEVEGLSLQQYFSTCYSDIILLWISRASLALIFLAGVFLFAWFLRQWWRLKKSASAGDSDSGGDTL